MEQNLIEGDSVGSSRSLGSKNKLSLSGLQTSRFGGQFASALERSARWGEFQVFSGINFSPVQEVERAHQLRLVANSSHDLFSLSPCNDGDRIVAAAFSGFSSLWLPKGYTVPREGANTRSRVAITAKEPFCFEVLLQALQYQEPTNTGRPAGKDGGASKIGIGRGKFWERTDIEVRNLFVVAMRHLRSTGCVTLPCDGIISDATRSAAVVRGERDFDRTMGSSRSALSQYRVELRDHLEKHVIMIPTTARLSPQDLDDQAGLAEFNPDIVEYAMPAILTDCISVNVPVGLSARGLPVSVQLLSSSANAGFAIRTAIGLFRDLWWPTAEQDRQEHVDPVPPLAP